MLIDNEVQGGDHWESMVQLLLSITQTGWKSESLASLLGQLRNCVKLLFTQYYIIHRQTYFPNLLCNVYLFTETIGLPNINIELSILVKQLSPSLCNCTIHQFWLGPCDV